MKSRYFPDFEEFRSRAEAYNVVPVVRDILADTLTPVSAFMKVDAGAEAFLLESVEGGEKWGRYSFLGTSPKAVIRSRGTKVEVIEDGVTSVIEADPFTALNEFISRYHSAPLNGEGETRFSGGAIGYMGYDMVRHIEHLPDVAKNDLNIYDMVFLLTETMLVFDNMEHKIKVVCNVFIDNGTDIESAYAQAIEKIDSLVERLRAPLDYPRPVPAEHLPVTSNYPREDFEQAVRDVKEFIVAGDVIQTVVAQRFETELNTRPLDIYRALRVTNPSPYMFFMRLGGVELAGSSPEILVRVEDGDMSVRPIAGTRPRGGDCAEDLAYEKDLLADPKELAEHLMLVDLGRNDLGRVAKAGSVNVDELMIIEKYSHVMHIVSNVNGKVGSGEDCFSVLRSCFPAGTLSGAPKIRAMEIIEEIEPNKRGVYGGCVGYFGFSGNMDMCITIRTVLIKNGRVYVQAGAGIVADSDPVREFEETENKARGVLKAVNMARDGLE